MNALLSAQTDKLRFRGRDRLSGSPRTDLGRARSVHLVRNQGNAPWFLLDRPNANRSSVPIKPARRRLLRCRTLTVGERERTVEMRVFSVWRLPSGPRTARIESKRDARVARRSLSFANSSGRTLIATSLSNFVSRARYTSPIPPAPTDSITSYWPRRVPGERAAIASCPRERDASARRASSGRGSAAWLRSVRRDRFP